VFGCRIAAAELLEPKPERQLELKFDQDHSFGQCNNQAKKEITDDNHAFDYGIKTA